MEFHDQCRICGADTGKDEDGNDDILRLDISRHACACDDKTNNTVCPAADLWIGIAHALATWQDSSTTVDTKFDDLRSA